MQEIPDEVYKKIKELYLKDMHIPEGKNVKQFILCPVGLIGSGKTTVIKPLAEKLKLVRISGDEIRKLFKESGYGYERTKELAYELVRDFLGKGFSIAIDSDCVSEETQKKIKEAEEQFGVTTVWIHINTPEKFILEMLQKRDTEWLGTSEVMMKNYHARKGLHEDMDFPFVYTLDTSKGDIEKQIDGAQEAILKVIGA